MDEEQARKIAAAIRAALEELGVSSNDLSGRRLSSELYAFDDAEAAAFAALTEED